MQLAGLGILLLVGALLLNGCQANGPANRENSEKATEEAVGEVDPIAYRTVLHELGEAKVPLKVEHVVALERSFADHLVALGIIPAGATVRDSGDFEPYLAPLLTGTESLGPDAAPQVDKIARLQPDLIIADVTNHTLFYEALNEIAATIYISQADLENNWEGVYQKIAEATGQQADASLKLEQFHTRTADLKEKLSGKLADRTVVFLKITDQDYRLLGNLSPLGKIAYGELGMGYPASLDDEPGESVVELVELQALDPDFIFLMETDVPEYADKINETMALPQWAGLQAVRAGQVYLVPLRQTETGSGLVMYHQFLDAVQQALLVD